jgi:MipA family protein
VVAANKLKHQLRLDAVHNKFMHHSIGPQIGCAFRLGAWRACGRSPFLRSIRTFIFGALGLLGMGGATGQVQSDSASSAVVQTQEQAPVPRPSEPDAATPPALAKKPKLQGAITSVVSWGPDYMGSKNYGVSIQPGLLLRYGRWSVSSNGNFAAPADDPNDLPRGLGLNLLGNQQDWVKLSLRVDSGRRSDGVSGLRGVDDVPRTLRLRLAARKEWGGGWVITPGVNLDLLGKGVGQTADLSVSREWKLSPKLSLSASTGLTWASRAYMSSYFGITQRESSASGYAVYEPDAGLRDMRLGTGLRYEINKRWVAVANASAQRLVGPAAKSPIVQSANQWGVGAGLGWRF